MSLRSSIALGLVCLAGLNEAAAQTAILSITTSASDTTNTTQSGITFDGNTVAVTSFSTATDTYNYTGVANAAYVRRNATNANNSSVWYYSVNSTEMRASYSNNEASLLLGNNLLRGSDNTFANGSAAQEGNIERLDFVRTTGFTATSGMAFSIFDRGDVGVHDGVKVAVITGWDSVNNRPTAYGGNLVSVTSANYGSANVYASNSYNLFRYSSGDNLATWNSANETANQGIGGVVITLADLGIAAGTTIYGYSIMGNDVSNGGSMGNLVDWTNATYYPTTTTSATGTGGIDLAAVNGVMYTRAVPEPSAYGATLLGLGACLLGYRRYRTTRRAS